MGYPFIGKGLVQLADFSSGSTFENRLYRHVGNARSLELTPSTEDKIMKDYRSFSGGVDSAYNRIEATAGKIGLVHFTPENLALALWGTTSALAATAIVGEAGYKIVPNAFIPTKRLINTSVAPVVKKGATTILAADYTVSAGGITIAATITTGSVSSGDAITIDYTPQAGADVQSMLITAPEVSIHMYGVNEVSGKYFSFKAFRAKLGTLDNLGLITDDFGVLQLPFTMQKDETIVTAGKSQYFELQQAS